MSRSTPRRRAVLAGLGLGGATLAAPAVAQGRRRWRMATAWPNKLPGPGISAARIAERIGTLSGGRLTVELFPAGVLAPGLGVFDVVASGGVELGHAASVFWSGKRSAAPLFTSAPFGLTPWEHL
ncbi:MAG: ABC transporter substrate-binding protein, partial [Pseudomonadota bacterium]